MQVDQRKGSMLRPPSGLAPDVVDVPGARAATPSRRMIRLHPEAGARSV
jgi:hypothetical protein